MTTNEQEEFATAFEKIAVEVFKTMPADAPLPCTQGGLGKSSPLKEYMPAILKALALKAEGNTFFDESEVQWDLPPKGTYEEHMMKLSELLNQVDVPNEYEHDYPYGGPSHGVHYIKFL
jgi:hypothetical protein